jgi:hypothetical protein
MLTWLKAMGGRQVHVCMEATGRHSLGVALALHDAAHVVSVVNLGSGADTLTLANSANSGTISKVETIMGGTGSDTITLGTAAVGASIDLGTGTDSLTLGAFTDTATVATTSVIIGGSGADNITLGSALTVSMSVDLGGGLNTLTLDNSTVMNFSTAKGDQIALDTTGGSVLSTNTYNRGGGALAVGTDLADVANATARLSTTLSNGGSGAFVYEQDTGALYCSGNGPFSGGGTLIGTVTTNGTTAWTFDANSFTQV